MVVRQTHEELGEVIKKQERLITYNGIDRRERERVCVCNLILAKLWTDALMYVAANGHRN